MSTAIISTAPLPAPTERTLLDYFEQTYRPLRLGNASPATIHHYQTQIRDFGKFLGRPATLSDLDEEAVVRMMSEHIRRGNSPATANKFKDCICAIWNYAFRKRAVETAPDIRPFKKPKRIPQSWSEAEAAHLIKTAYLGEWIKPFQAVIAGIPANLWWSALLHLTYDTGARIGAVRQLRVSDINLDTRHLLIPAEFQKHFEDQSFWPQSMTCHLLRQFANVERELLFPFPYNIATFYNRLDKLLQFAGLPHGRRDKMHRMRRTTATLCEIHVGRGSASAYLGHDSPETTRAYIDTTKLPESRIADRLPRPLLFGFEGLDGEIPAVETLLPEPLAAPVPIEHHVAAVILPHESITPDAHPMLDVDPLELLPAFVPTAWTGEMRRKKGYAHLRSVFIRSEIRTIREIEAGKIWEWLEGELRTRRIAPFWGNQIRISLRRFLLWLVAERGVVALCRVADELTASAARKRLDWGRPKA